MGNPYDIADDDPEYLALLKRYGVEPPQAPQNAGQNSGWLGDTATGLKRGVQQLPGIATGLADIVAAPISKLTGVNRPFSRAADAVGEFTGFQPDRWQKEAQKEYSPQLQEDLRAVDKAEGFWGTTGEVLRRPRALSNFVAEAIPGTVASGFMGRAAMGTVMGAEALAANRAALAAGGAGADAARTALVNAGVKAGALGEGTIQAGSQMSQLDYDVDPLRAAGTSALSGVTTGLLGYGGGKLAGRLGLQDVEGAIAAGALRNTGRAGMGAYARGILGGGVSEGVFEELPQGATEQVWQNLAEGKPWDENVGKAAAQSMLAGMAMGAGANVLQPNRPQGEKPLTEDRPTNLLGAPVAGQQLDLPFGMAEQKQFGMPFDQDTEDANAALAGNTVLPEQKSKQDWVAIRQLRDRAEAAEAQADAFMVDGDEPGAASMQAQADALYKQADKATAKYVKTIAEANQKAKDAEVKATETGVTAARKVKAEKAQGTLPLGEAAPTAPLAYEPTEVEQAARDSDIPDAAKVGLFRKDGKMRDHYAKQVMQWNDWADADLLNTHGVMAADFAAKKTIGTMEANRMSILESLLRNRGVEFTSYAESSAARAAAAPVAGQGAAEAKANAKAPSAVTNIDPATYAAQTGAPVAPAPMAAPTDLLGGNNLPATVPTPAGPGLAPVPASTEPSLPVEVKLPKVQQRVFDHVVNAMQNDAIGTVVDAQGMFMIADIGRALNMKPGSVKMALKAIQPHLAKALGAGSVAEVKAQQGTRNVEEADATQLGLAPKDQRTNAIAEEDLFGGGEESAVTQGMGIVSGPGGSQANIFDGDEVKVPEAWLEPTEADKVRDAKRAEEAKVNAVKGLIADVRQKVKRAPEAMNTWNEYAESTTPLGTPFHELAERTMALWLLEYDALIEKHGHRPWVQLEPMIAKLYNEYATDTWVNQNEQGKIEATGRVRQPEKLLTAGETGARSLAAESQTAAPEPAKAPAEQVAAAPAPAEVLDDDVKDLWNEATAPFGTLTFDQLPDDLRAYLLQQPRTEAALNTRAQEVLDALMAETATMAADLDVAEEATPKAEVVAEPVVERPAPARKRVRVKKSVGQKEAGTNKDAVTTKLKKLFFNPDNFGKLVTVVQSIDDVPSEYRADLPATTRGFIAEGRVYLIADNIPAGSELAVMLHELGSHIGMPKLLGAANYARLVKQLHTWAEKNDGSLESRLANKALGRIRNAETATGKALDESDANDELLAYFIEEAVENGLDPTAIKNGGPLYQWFRTLWAAAKVALRKIGLNRFDDITAQNIVDLAYGAAKLEITGTWHGTAADFRNFNHDYMGSGEGAQAYGWGTYLAQRPGIAKEYWKADVKRKSRRDDRVLSGIHHDLMGSRSNEESATRNAAEARESILRMRQELKDVTSALQGTRSGDSNSYWKDYYAENIAKTEAFASTYENSAQASRQATERTLKRLADMGMTEDELNKAMAGPEGSLMRADVNVHDDEMLDWDKPLSEQPSIAEKLAQNVGEQPTHAKGESFADFVKRKRAYEKTVRASAPYVVTTEQGSKYYLLRDGSVLRDKTSSSTTFKADSIAFVPESVADKMMSALADNPDSRFEVVVGYGDQPQVTLYRFDANPHKPDNRSFDKRVEVLSEEGAKTPSIGLVPVESASGNPHVGHKVTGVVIQHPQAAVEHQQSELSGRLLYATLTRELGSDKLASTYLDSIGIKGLRFLDQPSRKYDGATFKVVEAGEYRTKLEQKKPFTVDVTEKNGGSLSMQFATREEAEKWIAAQKEQTRNLVIFNDKNIHRIYTEVGANPYDIKFSIGATNSAAKAGFEKQTASAIAQLKEGANRALHLVAFTRDLVDIAHKEGLTTARNYYRLSNMRDAEQTRIESEVDRILTDAYKLSKGDRAAAQKFIKESTIEQKWGFMPDWKKGATVDPEFKKKFSALSKEAQTTVKQLFKHADTMHKQLQEQINAEIDREYDKRVKAALDAGNDGKAREIERDRKRALSVVGRKLPEMQGPYAPLKRFGNHVFVGKSQRYLDAEREGDKKEIARLIKLREGDYEVTFFDTKYQAELYDRENQHRFARTDNFNRMMGYDKFKEVPWGEILKIKTAIESEIGELKGKNEMQRLVTDLYISMLSDASARKTELRREGVEGASDEMFRAFATKGRADAHFFAAMKHNGGIQRAISDMRMQTTQGDKDGQLTEPGQRDRRALVFDEIIKRHAQQLNYTPTPFADKAMRFTSWWMLLTSPGYYIQNALQVGMLTLPVLAGSRMPGSTNPIGAKAAASALTRAYGNGLAKAVLAAGNTLDTESLEKRKIITPAERRMLDTLIEQGKVDITIAQDLGRAAAGEGFMDNMPYVGAGLRAIQNSAQRLEMLNRVVTALAAYRLTGDTEFAGKVIEDSHGNYTMSNAPRWMQGNSAARLLTQFRKFQLIQLSLLGRQVATIMNSADPKEKAAAWATLRWIATTHGIMAGGLGLPVISQALALLAPLFGLGGDDDEPEDVEGKLRKAIGNEDTSNLLLRGVPAWMGMNMSGKVGMGNTFSVFPFLNTSGQAGYEKALVGMGGAAVATGLNMAKGADLIRDGEYYKGLELMLPKGVRDAMRAGRFTNEGITNRRGDVLMTPDELSLFDVGTQGLGLPSTKLQERQRRVGQAIEYDTFYKERTTALRDKYAKAYRAGDQETVNEVRSDWRDMSTAMRANGLQPPPMSSLFKAPMEQRKRERNVVEGVQHTARTKKLVESAAAV